jgi:5-methylthioadenosine/S-adenosylhomocysteine deaminase
MSNNNLSMLGTMNFTALLHKVVREDPTVVPARQVVYLATQGGANVLGLGDRIGSLEPGKRADLVLLRLDRPHAVPLYDPYSHLAYVLTDSDVDTVVIDGQVVYDADRLTTIDLADARAVVQDLARQIGAARVGPRVADLHPGAIAISDDFDAPLPDAFWLGESQDD